MIGSARWKMRRISAETDIDKDMFRHLILMDLSSSLMAMLQNAANFPLGLCNIWASEVSLPLHHQGDLGEEVLSLQALS